MTHKNSDQKTDFPWKPVLVLAAATLLMVTAEMLPMAVLAPMSEGLGVRESETGMLVSVWAAIVVIASFPLSRIARRWSPRTVIIAGVLALALSSVLTASASNFAIAIGARIVGAAAVGLLWATVNSFVAGLVTDRMLGRAISLVLGGATLGMVIGAPLGRLLAEATDWRFAFALLGALLLMVALAVRLAVPPLARAVPAPGESSDEPARVAGVGRQLGILTALVAFALIGHYGAFTFITRLAEPAAEILPGGTSAVLLVFGVASAVGVGLAARVTTRTAGALVVAVGLTGVAIAAFVAADLPFVSAAVVIAWGIASGAFPPLAQTLILRTAGPARRDFAGALIPVVFNGGIAVGAGLTSALVGVGGPAAIPLPAAAFVILAAVALVVFTRTTRAPSATDMRDRAEVR